jgi:hypothetical protein
MVIYDDLKKEDFSFILVRPSTWITLKYLGNSGVILLRLDDHFL